MSATPAHSQNLRRDFWIPNGGVSALVAHGDILYVAGGFNYIGPPTGGGAPIDALTGSVTAYPHIDGKVFAAAPDGSGGWYIGGDFASVGGASRANLAHILADGSVTSWNPGANQPVYEVAAHGSMVFVAGSFTQLAGQPRTRLAALDATTGALLTVWNPSPSADVSDMAPTDSVLYVSGSFTTIGGQPRNRIAALDLITGNATAWNPNANGGVNTIELSDSLVYAGGSFTGIGPRARNYLAAIDAVTGLATTWIPNPNSTVGSLSVDGSTVYFSGSFQTVGGVARNKVAAVDVTSGALTPWAPVLISTYGIANVDAGDSFVYVNGSFASFNGQSRRGVAALDKLTGVPVAWNPNPESISGFVPAAGALVVDGSTVFVGGDFRSIGGVYRGRLAAIDANTGRPTSWDSGWTYSSGGGTTSIYSLAKNESSLLVCQSYNLAFLDLATGANQSYVSGNPVVYAVGVDGQTLYVGGQFSQLGTGTLPNFDAINGTGAPLPSVSSYVRSVQVDGGHVYIAGNFEYVGGQFRSHIASFDIATGNVDSWNPEAVGAVTELAIANATVYAAGTFTAIGGDFRNSLAALDPLTGFATPWNPNPNDEVTALGLGGSSLYVGGDFNTIGGQPRSSIAAFDLVSGSLSDWDPNAGGGALSVSAIAVAGNSVFIGGGFNSIAGWAHRYLAGFESPVADVPVSTASHLELAAGPNPSRGSVRVQFSLANSERVNLSVFDLQGREVARLADGELPAGPHQFVWNAGQGSSRVENGVYFLRLSAADRHASKRIVLVR